MLNGIKGKSYALEYFIERPRLGLDFSYEFEGDERSGKYFNTSDNTSTWTEEVDIETQGWLYHPALMIYRLSLSPEWEQLSERHSGGSTENSRTFTLGYSADATFLQYKPYTINLFGEKDTSTILSSFAERSKKESDTYGARLIIKYDLLPSFLNYIHVKSKQTGFNINNEERDEFYLNMKHNRQTSRTVLNASYTDGTHTTPGIFLHTLQKKADLHNISEFTEQRNMILDSLFSLDNTDTSIFKSTRYSIYENLRHIIRKNLTADYHLGYDKSNIRDIQSGKPSHTENKTAGFDLTHLLYENLTTSFALEGSQNTFEGGKITSYGPELTLRYDRKIPWGTLNINIGHGYKITENNTIPSDVHTFGEDITLKDNVITTLKNKHIDINSVVVKKDNLTAPYTKDADYTVTEAGPFVRIICKTGGKIDTDFQNGASGGCSIGAPVLVDYSYFSGLPFNYSSFSRSYGISLDLWSAWRVYYRYDGLKQKLRAGTPPDSLSNDKIHFTGTQLDWKWSRTNLEYEYRDTTQIPLKRWLAEETLSFRPNDITFLSLSAAYGATKLLTNSDVSRFRSLKANYQMIIAPWGKLQIEGFINKNISPAEHLVSMGFSSVFEWVYYIWNGNMTYRFTDDKESINRESHNVHYILFELKRALF